MKTSEIVRTLIASLQENLLYNDIQHKYWYCDPLTPGGILFIGINPSEQENNEKIECHELLQEGNNHPYFKRFEEISKQCNTPWTHIDLLFYRGKQKAFYEILKMKSGAKYIEDQLKTSKQLIESCKPKIIVVANALASRFFKENDFNGIKLGYDLKFDEKIGTYIWNEIPVFLSGMFSGQHALDIGSYERLKWHIKEVLKKYNSLDQL